MVRNDRATVDELLIRGYDRVIVSPGPCTPDEAGISLEAVRRFPRGAGSRRSASASAIRRSCRRGAAGSSPTTRSTARRRRSSTTARTIFRGLPTPLEVGRYHSLIADPALPDVLEQSAVGRRRRHGGAPPRAARRGRPVSSRVGAHRSTAASCWPTSWRSSRPPPGRRPSRGPTWSPRTPACHGEHDLRSADAVDRRAGRRPRPQRRADRRRCWRRSWPATPRRSRSPPS